MPRSGPRWPRASCPAWFTGRSIAGDWQSDDDPARQQRGLAAAGLHPLWSHWVIPGFSQARRYLPLDQTKALRWYFSTLHPAGRLPGALAAAGAGLLGRGEGKGLAATAPTFGITAVAAPLRPGRVR